MKVILKKYHYYRLSFFIKIMSHLIYLYHLKYLNNLFYLSLDFLHTFSVFTFNKF